MLGSATAESFRSALPPLLADPGIDAVIALFVPAASVAAEGVGTAISMAVAEADQPDKPVLASILAAAGPPATLRSAAHVPAFSYPEAAAAALGRAVEYGEWLRHSAGSVVHLDDVDRGRGRGGRRDALSRTRTTAWLDPAATRRLLAAYRIPLVPERLADTAGGGSSRGARSSGSRWS